MHQEAIISKARPVLAKLKNFPEFYLAGGTGLALQLGHRISIDFDLFTSQNLPKDLLQKMKKVFPKSKIEVIVKRSEQLTVTINEINLSFIKGYYPVISKLIDYQGIKVLPAKEIAAMKAYALGRRATLKDYVDLYFCLKQGIVSLKNLIELAEKKFGEEFDRRLFLEQLVYAQDVEAMAIKFLKGKISKEAIEKFFEQQVKRLIV